MNLEIVTGVDAENAYAFNVLVRKAGDTIEDEYEGRVAAFMDLGEAKRCYPEATFVGATNDR